MKTICIGCAMLCWSAGLCAEQTTFLLDQDYWNDWSAWDNGIPNVTKDAIIPNDLWCILDSYATAKSLTCKGGLSIYPDSSLTMVEASSINKCYLNGIIVMNKLSIDGFLDVDEGCLYGNMLVNYGDVSFCDPYYVTCIIENHSTLNLNGNSISIPEITGDGAITCQCDATVSSITASGLVIGASSMLVPEPPMTFYGIIILLLVFVVRFTNYRFCSRTYCI